MKKALLSCLLAVIVVSSCKKEQKKPAEDPEKTYAVNFNLSGFTTDISPAPQRTNAVIGTNALPSSVTRLFYRVYNSTNTLIRKIDQDSSTTNFGKIADRLPTGTYKVYLCAGTNISISEDGSPATALLETRWFQGYPTKWNDTFVKNLSLTVNDGDSNQNVTMERIVTKIAVKILDKVPDNANKLVIELDKDYNYYSLATNAPVAATIPGIDYMLKTRTKEVLFTAADKGTLNYTTSMINLYTGNDVKVTISCYDINNKLIAQRVVNNVILQKNTQTILSGNLFTADSTPFNITINMGWDSGYNIGF